MEATQVQKLKLNVTNINSFLKKSNKTYIGLKKQNSTLLSNQIQRRKQESKEKKIETRRTTGFGLGKVGDKIASTGGSIFDKILGFGSFILAGVLVNSLPTIAKKVMEFVDNIVNFVTPIYSSFRVLQAIINKEPLDDPELSPEKKRFTDELKKAKIEVDKLKKDLGIAGPIISPLQNFISDLVKEYGGDDIVLATKKGEDGKDIEGFLNLKTDEFFQKQFTSAERERFNQQKQGAGRTTSNISSLGSGNLKLNNLTDQDYSDLAYAVSGEAQRGTDDEYGVAANILTRVADPGYPNTIMEVFTAPGQYAAYSDGGAYRDPQLASKLKANKDKIADAIQILNGRTDFKGTSQYGNMGPGDIMFSSRGNFYHYASQRGRNDPAPKNPPQYWKKLVNSKSNPPKIKPITRDKNNQASVLNTTIGEEGSTTFVLMRQQVIT